MSGQAVLTLLPPWLIAIPLPAVRQLVAGEDTWPVATATTGGPMVVQGRDGLVAAWSLAGLLHLAEPSVPTLAILATPGIPLAVTVGRCLGLVDPGRILPLPPGALREPLGLGCFAAGEAAARCGAAPVGLWLDPLHLIGPERRRLAGAALAAAAGRAA